MFSSCYDSAVAVQRKFIKTLVRFKDMSYRVRVIALKLKLPSLERMRLTADLSLTYKIMLGQAELKMNDSFVLKNQGDIVVRGNRFKIAINHTVVSLTLGEISEQYCISFLQSFKSTLSQCRIIH